MQDVVLVVEVVELLRQLERIFCKVRGLCGRDGLIDHPFQFAGGKPNLPDLVVV